MLAKSSKFDFMIKDSFRTHEHGDIIEFVSKVLLHNMAYPDFFSQAKCSDIIYILLLLMWIFLYCSRRQLTSKCVFIKQSNFRTLFSIKPEHSQKVLYLSIMRIKVIERSNKFSEKSLYKCICI